MRRRDGEGGWKVGKGERERDRGRERARNTNRRRKTAVKRFKVPPPPSPFMFSAFVFSAQADIAGTPESAKWKNHPPAEIKTAVSRLAL